MTRTKMTSKNEGFYNNYKRAEITSIRDAYKNPSYYKTRAEELILRDMDKLNGFDPKITSNNCQFFSMAFTYPCPETGELRLRYYTGMNVYDFAISE